MPTTNVTSKCEALLQEIADTLAKSRKILVVTGAGISTNCGIPDFRSENGLYALIQAQYDAAAKVKVKDDDAVEVEEERPAKRRKLTRSCSAGALREENNESASAPSRQLRSSRSFSGTMPQPAAIDDQPRARLRRRLTENIAPAAERQSRRSRQASPTSSSGTPSSDDDAPPSSQTSNASSTRASLPNLKGKDLFDSIIWSDALTTSIFYTFVSSLRHKILNDVKSTTETHKFIRALRDAGRLVRNYTQNIDMLESREGLCTELERGTGSRNRFSQKFQREAQQSNDAEASQVDSGVEVVYLHGSLDKLRCGLCAKSSSWDEEDRHQTTLAGQAPDCPWCVANSAHREGKGRRSLAVGRLRPDIVLYGEEHPLSHKIGPLITHDLSLGPDVLLILGTSLRVHGLKVIIREFSKAVHGRSGKVIFINQTKPPESIWGDVIDYWIEWDCDAWVADLKERRHDIWSPIKLASDNNGSKEEKPKLPAKNPVATRPDVTNGAYLTMKIFDRLGRISGRVVDNEPQKPPPSAAAAKSAQTPTIRPSTLLTSVKPAQTPTIPPRTLSLPPIVATAATATAAASPGHKRKRSLPRPNAIRNNRENGAYLTWEIFSSLQRLREGMAARSAWPSLPSISAMSSMKSSPAPPLPVLTTVSGSGNGGPPAAVPLAEISRNVGTGGGRGGVRTRASLKLGVGNGECGEGQLPTPPNSDVDKGEPMTPKSRRIKAKSSIGAILSSPLKNLGSYFGG